MPKNPQTTLTRSLSHTQILSLSLKVWHSCPFTQSKLNYQKFFLKLQLTSKALFLSVSNFLKFSLMLVRSVGFQINLKLMSQYDFNEAQQQLVFSFIPLNRLWWLIWIFQIWLNGLFWHYLLSNWSDAFKTCDLCYWTWPLYLHLYLSRPMFFWCY